jgi:N-methylhydantoinase A/oxoprolinase/acetone carboxylase beta subunit
MATSKWRAGVDIGGTFTDLLLVEGASGQFRVGKVLTTANEPAAGVRTALTTELRSSDLSAASLGTVVHGTTLVTTRSSAQGRRYRVADHRGPAIRC